MLAEQASAALNDIGEIYEISSGEDDDDDGDDESATKPGTSDQWSRRFKMETIDQRKNCK